MIRYTCAAKSHRHRRVSRIIIKARMIEHVPRNNRDVCRGCPIETCGLFPTVVTGIQICRKHLTTDRSSYSLSCPLRISLLLVLLLLHSFSLVLCAIERACRKSFTKSIFQQWIGYSISSNLFVLYSKGGRKKLVLKRLKFLIIKFISTFRYIKIM